MLYKPISSWLFVFACFAVACIAVVLIKSQAPEYEGSKAVVGYYLLGFTVLGFGVASVLHIGQLFRFLPEEKKQRPQGIAKQGQNGGDEAGLDAEHKDEGAE